MLASLSTRMAVGLVVILALAGPTPLLGQSDDYPGTLEWVALAGAYAPMSSLGTISGLGSSDGTYSLTQDAGFAVGVGVAAWWQRYLGWDASFVLVPGGTVTATSGSGADACGSDLPDCTSDVWVGTSRLLLRYMPPDSDRWNVYLAGGLSVTGHHGAVWQQKGAMTDLGGVLGVGGAWDISPRFALRGEVEDYIYSFNPRFEPETGVVLEGSPKLQNDLLFSVSLAIRFLGR